MATKKPINLDTLSDQQLEAELLRRKQEKEKPMREAMQRLGQIASELDTLFLESSKLCKEFKIPFNYQLGDWQVTVDRNGYRTVESTWDESSWQSSSC